MDNPDVTIRVDEGTVAAASKPFIDALSFAVGFAHDDDDYSIVASDALLAAYSEGLKFGVGEVLAQFAGGLREMGIEMPANVSLKLADLAFFVKKHNERWPGGWPARFDEPG